MAEDAKEAKGEAQEPPKKSKKKLFIIIIAVVVLLGVGGGGYFFFVKKGGDTTAEEDHGGKKGKHGEEEVADVPQIMDFEPFIVNLTNTAGNRYLKVTLNIEFDSPVLEEAKTKTAQIRDSIIILLSSKSYSDVGSVPGKYQLRDEIAARVNLILSEGRVKSVYFTEFVIQ